MAEAEKVFFIRDNKIGFGSLANTGKITNLSATTGSKLKIHYYHKDTAFTTTLTETPNFPSQFHEALVYGVLKKLAAKKRDLKMAGYWKNEYKTVVNDAKRYFNEHRTFGIHGVQLHEM